MAPRHQAQAQDQGQQKGYELFLHGFHSPYSHLCVFGKCNILLEEQINPERIKKAMSVVNGAVSNLLMLRVSPYLPMEGAFPHLHVLQAHVREALAHGLPELPALRWQRRPAAGRTKP